MTHQDRLSQKFSSCVNAKDWDKPTGTAVATELDVFNRPNHGFEALPEVVTYHDPQYQGHERRTNLNCYILGKDQNDKISSIIVVRGTWRFYSDNCYKGDYWDLTPGYYPIIGTANDVISSFQCIQW